MPATQEHHREGYLPQLDAAVCCRLCDPPRRVEVPARVFYRLKDEDTIACPNGHQGTLLEYKQAASERGAVHGPFIRYDHHSTDWLSRNPWPR
jgi:hypothetical protein